MPVRGTLVLPSEDTETPPTPAEAGRLTPDWFDIPKVRCFTPAELARYFATDAKSITRLIEEGWLEAFPFRITHPKNGENRVSWKIPYRAVVQYFARMQGAMN
jgi:hypothetical protein